MELNFVLKFKGNFIHLGQSISRNVPTAYFVTYIINREYR